MKKFIIYIFIFTILFSFIFSSVAFASEITENSVNSINSLTIYSNCVLMIEKNTGDILFERNSDEKMYPASTTKILTAILVLENCDLNEIAHVSALAIKAVPQGYKKSDIQVGEKLRVEDLLYTMLIPSANDAANVLAEYISGSITGFSELMNEKAKELGCTNSHFTNPSGIHDENLYTTAHDLALIARYAMNIEKFREIVTTTEYTLPSTESYPYSDRTFEITNSLMNPKELNYYYEYATGVKTGYTNPAGDCLVASAKKDEVEFIIVVLDSGLQENGLFQKYLDCKTLFDFAFDNYTSYYQNLQQKKRQKGLNYLEFNSIVEKNDTNTDYSVYRNLSGITAALIIISAFILLFRRKKEN